ncbi:UNVERIFIED_CONTAM: hypothetical protein H355_002837, partial [Colinus virginianus]
SEQSRLAELEEQAKSSKKGMWSEGTGSHTVRDLKYTIENPRHFVDSMHQKPVNAIIEHVRDGSVVRALLLPDYYLVTVMLSGIKVRFAKERKLRIWRDYVAPTANLDQKDKQFVAK